MSRRVSWLAPNLTQTLARDRLMVQDDDVLFNDPDSEWHVATFRSMVPDLEKRVAKLGAEGVPLTIEKEAVFGNGSILAVRVPQPSLAFDAEPRPAWRNGCHLLWLEEHLWWVNEAASADEWIADIRRRVAPIR